LMKLNFKKEIGGKMSFIFKNPKEKEINNPSKN